ncbi:MAG TPA: NAD(P)-dependent oxidoreductase [Lentimicrobium sp.]|nr:NAD(P)-dependent oxidoreductase [Lentimicrobium sp.]
MAQGKVLFIDTAHPYLTDELIMMGYNCVHYTGLSRKEILDQIQQYTGIIIRSKIKLDKEALDLAKNLRFIGRVGAGMENIDSQYAESKGITCLNAPEGNRDAVAEHAMGMILSLLNHLCRVNTEVRNGIWIRDNNRGTEIKGKTVGIIGFGNTGSEFAKRLTGFGADILVYDKYKSGFGNELINEVPMDEVFESADIVSLHIPFTKETNQLVSSNWIHHFKKPFYLINTSRGQCVNTTDLMTAIESGKILGAALDVLECEQLSFENLDTADLPPSIKALFQSDKVILSPHIAGWTVESHFKLAKTLVDKIRKL